MILSNQDAMITFIYTQHVVSIIPSLFRPLYHPVLMPQLCLCHTSFSRPSQFCLQVDHRGKLWALCILKVILFSIQSAISIKETYELNLNPYFPIWRYFRTVMYPLKQMKNLFLFTQNIGLSLNYSCYCKSLVLKWRITQCYPADMALQPQIW